jgi:AraC family transcriptional regulator, positive regulator of tynA and feaB
MPDVQLTSSNTFPPRQRFCYWADVVAETFVPLQFDTPDRAMFFGELRHRQIGLVGVTEVRASAMVARRTKTKIAAAPRDDAIVVLQIAGTCKAGQRKSVAQLRPGDGAIVVADEPYFFDFSSAFRQLVLKVPKCLIGGGRKGGTGHVDGLLLSVSGARLLRKLGTCSLNEPLSLLPGAEVGVERALVELLRAAMPSAGNHCDAKLPPLYVSACQFIRRHLHDPTLNPLAVAEHAKLSTRQLARVFAHQGTTIDRTIWSERLTAARRDLIDPRLRECSITEIAFSWAFSDAAHFSRRFSAAFGLSPTAYRGIRSAGSSGELSPNLPTVGCQQK